VYISFSELRLIVLHGHDDLIEIKIIVFDRSCLISLVNDNALRVLRLSTHITTYHCLFLIDHADKLSD